MPNADKPHLQLLKFLDTSWEQARADLRTDLEHVENAFNSRQTITGQVQLVNGTALVETADIQPGRIIFLQRKIAAGTIGDLTYTQLDSISFRINSSSATDGSTVNWVIMSLDRPIGT